MSRNWIIAGVAAVCFVTGISLSHLIEPLAKFIDWRSPLRSVWRLVLLTLAAGSGNAFGFDTNFVPKSIPELRTAVESVLKETKTPGAAIAIVSRSRAVWVAGIGMADVAANRPVTTNTLFPLGSISKSIVALAALQLQEGGKLKLSDTVRQWVPEVAVVNPWEAADPVRLVHLLEHTSGFDDMHLREYALDDPAPKSLKDALAYDAAARVCRWPPGTRMAYSSSGPGVLGAVIEKASGRRFEDYVQEHVFNPLHMDTAGYFLTPESEHLFARLYHPDGITPHPFWHIALRPTAAANASANDMANYVRFYLQRGSLDGARVLSPASIERMETTKTMPSAGMGRMMNYGLCNYPILEGPFVFRGHNGAVVGGVAQMAYLPDRGFGYAIMINSGNFHAELQIGKLIRRYLTNSLAPPALPAPAPVPAGLKQQYQGFYQLISPAEQWAYGFTRITDVRRLTFTATGISTSIYGLKREQWVPLSGQLFRRTNESVAEVALLPDADGARLIQCGTDTFKKISAWQFWAQLMAAGLVSALALSSLLLAPIRVILWFRGKRYPAGPLWVRVWPTVSAALLVAFPALLAYGFRGPVIFQYIDGVSLGIPNVLTVSVMLATLSFPIAAAAALYVAWRERKTPMKRASYWHSVLVAVAMIANAIYYGYWGLIGLRLWA